jgi:ribosome-associated protein
MAGRSSSREAALAAARLLADHKGEDTVVLDIADSSGFADFFVITTARSSVHLAGLGRAVAEGLEARGMRPVNRHKGRAEAGWLLLDCGDLIVHVMEREQRSFYDLERLWFRAEKLPY